MEFNGEWALVRQGNIEGWIPKWYISDDPGPVKDIESEHMVLNRSAPGLLYPGGPQAVSLDKGRLLLPLKQWNGWVQVEIIVYSIPGVMTAWVEKEFLSPVNGVTPAEGFLKQGSTAYVGCEFEEIDRCLSEEAAYNMPVQIYGERNGYLNVAAAGGWSAWTKKENISFARQDHP
ncbi:MAG: hypothetical protein M1130_05975 [Actinobacteria bacterium]|nr:hypothetical protein [Actinomycetota bacterium]